MGGKSHPHSRYVFGRVNLTWPEFPAEFPAEIWRNILLPEKCHWRNQVKISKSPIKIRESTNLLSKSSNYPWKFCKINVTDTPCLQNPCDFCLLLLDTFSGDGKSLINTGKTIQWWFSSYDYRRIFSYFLSMSWQKNDRNLWAVPTSWSPNSLGTPSREEPVSFQRGRSCITPRGWRFVWWMGMIEDPNSLA